jgi:hypothetical protein
VLFHPNRKPPSTVFSVFLTDRQREPYSSSSRPSRLDHRRIDPSPSRSADRANRIIHSPEHLVQNESSLLCRYQEAGPGRFVGTTRRDSHFDHRSGSPIFDNRTNSSRDNRVSVNLVVSSHNRALRDARAPSPARFFADDHTRGDIHLFISAIWYALDSLSLGIFFACIQWCGGACAVNLSTCSLVCLPLPDLQPRCPFTTGGVLLCRRGGIAPSPTELLPLNRPRQSVHPTNRATRVIKI